MWGTSGDLAVRPFRGAGLRTSWSQESTQEHWLEKGGRGGVILEGAPGPWFRLAGEEEILGSRLRRIGAKHVLRNSHMMPDCHALCRPRR